MVLWLEFWGSPSSLKVLKRPVFELIFMVFKDFEALKGAQKLQKTLKTLKKKSADPFFEIFAAVFAPKTGKMAARRGSLFPPRTPPLGGKPPKDHFYL